MENEVQLANITNPDDALQEQVENTINALDEYIQLLNDTYNEETGGADPENQKLMSKIYELCITCNNWMAVAGYPEDEMYDI